MAAIYGPPGGGATRPGGARTPARGPGGVANWRPPRPPHSFTAIPIHRAIIVATDPVLAPLRRPFRALASTVVPEAVGLDEKGWSELERIVEDDLARRPPAIRRQLRLLIRALDLLPLLRWGRRFSALDAARRDRVLRTLGEAPVLLLRRGVWGLRVLVQMGYYAQPAQAAAIGYRADPRGWEARR